MSPQLRESILRVGNLLSIVRSTDEHSVGLIYIAITLLSSSLQKTTEKVRKAPVSYRSAGQLPRESEVKQLKIYVGEFRSCESAFQLFQQVQAWYQIICLR